MLFRAITVASVDTLSVGSMPKLLPSGACLLCADSVAGQAARGWTVTDKFRIDRTHSVFCNTEGAAYLASDRPQIIYRIGLRLNHVELQAALTNVVAPYLYINPSLLLIVQQTVDGSSIATPRLNQAVDMCLSELVARTISQAKAEMQDLLILPTSAPDTVYRIYLLLYEYIEAHLREDIPVADVATAIQVSERYLNALLQKYSGCTTIQLINSCRINRSKQYLRSTDLTITEIATLVGFKSIHYFSRVFTSHEGLSPIAFRRAKRSK